MSPVPMMADIREQLYLEYPQLAGKKKNAPADQGDAQLKLATERLAQIESGLHPTCEACGERIEIDRLKASALESRCARCEGVQLP